MIKVHWRSAKALSLVLAVMPMVASAQFAVTSQALTASNGMAKPAVNVVNNTLGSTSAYVQGSTRFMDWNLSSNTGANTRIADNQLSMNMSVSGGAYPISLPGSCFYPCDSVAYSFNGTTTWELGFNVAAATDVSMSASAGTSMSVIARLYRLSVDGEKLVFDFTPTGLTTQLDAGSYRLDAVASLSYSARGQGSFVGSANVAILAALPTAVPEPASMSLMTMGLCGVAIAARRRQRRSWPGSRP